MEESNNAQEQLRDNITLFAQEVVEQAVLLLNKELNAMRLPDLEARLTEFKGFDFNLHQTLIIQKAKSVLTGNNPKLFEKEVSTYFSFIDSYVSKGQEIDCAEAEKRINAMHIKLTGRNDLVYAIEQYNESVKKESDKIRITEQIAAAKRLGIDSSYQRVLPHEHFVSLVERRKRILESLAYSLQYFEYDFLNRETKKQLSELVVELRSRLPKDLTDADEFLHLKYGFAVPKLAPNSGEHDPVVYEPAVISIKPKGNYASVDDAVLHMQMGLDGAEKAAEVKQIKVPSDSRPCRMHYIAERKVLASTEKPIYTCSCEDFTLKSHPKDYRCKHIEEIVATR